MGKKYYPYPDQPGYTEIIGAESALELLGFGLINLRDNATIKLSSGNYELGLVVLSGCCTIECAGQRFENLSRKDVFSANPVSVYIPIASDYQVTAHGRVEIAVCKVKAERKYAPFVVKAEEVISNHRGA